MWCGAAFTSPRKRGVQWSRIAAARKPDSIDFIGNSKISSFCSFAVLQNPSPTARWCYYTLFGRRRRAAFRREEEGGGGRQHSGAFPVAFRRKASITPASARSRPGAERTAAVFRILRPQPWPLVRRRQDCMSPMSRVPAFFELSSLSGKARGAWRRISATVERHSHAIVRACLFGAAGFVAAAGR